MVALRDAVAKFHGGIVIPETSAKGESQSNGAAESAGRLVREFTRVFKIQAEEKAGVEIGGTDPILHWAVRWAAMVCSRYLVGVDGKTGWERRRGRKCRVPVCLFWEKVRYKEIRKSKNKKHHLETEEREGIWLGHARSSNEVYIGTRNGVVRAYKVKRRDAQSQWDAELIKQMRGTPRQPDPNKPGYSIECQINFDPESKEPHVEIQTNRPELDIRRMRITPAILREFGYTVGCEGCRYKQAGLADGRNHSERCRARIFEALGETEEGKKIRERETERLNRRMEEAHVALTENSEAPRDAPGDIEMVTPNGPENIACCDAQEHLDLHFFIPHFCHQPSANCSA